MKPILQFEVKNQILIRKDNFHVVENSQNYLCAQFNFNTDDWNDASKTATFSFKETNYEAILDKDGKCTIPWEVIKYPLFCVSVFGVKDGTTITTDSCLIRVDRTQYNPDETPRPPSSTVYEQLLEELQKKGDTLEVDGYEIRLKSGDKVLSRQALPAAGGGVSDYELLANKPSINGEELIGEKSLKQLGIDEITNLEIEEIIKSIGGL